MKRKKVVVAERLDGSLHIISSGAVLKYKETTERPSKEVAPSMKNKFLSNIWMITLQFLKLLPIIAAIYATSAMAQEINQNEIWLGTETFGRYAELAERIESVERDITKIPIERLGPLCLSYSRLKRYDKLFPCIQELEVRVARNQAVAPPPMIFAGPTDFSPLSKMLSAEALLELGDYRKSIAEGEIALSRVREQIINGAIPSIRYKSTILSNLAIAAMLNNDRAAAFKYVQTLEQTPLNAVGGVALYSRMKENALGRAKMALGDCEGALADTEAGLASAVGVFGSLFLRSKGETIENVIDIPRLIIRGKCLMQFNRVEEARQALDQLLANRRTSEQGEIFWLALFERGRVAEADKKPDDAIQFYARAIEVIERQRTTINTELSKIGFAGDKQSVYARLISLLVQKGGVEEAFDYVERSKSRALVDMLAVKKDFSAPSTDPDKIRKILAQLDAMDIASHEKNDMAKAGEGSTTSRVRSLAIVHKQIQATAPELATLVSVGGVPSKELKSLIGQDETLVEYYYQDKDLYAFLLNSKRLQVIKLAGEGLEKQVRELRSALEQVRSDTWKAPAEGLYARLWQPLDGLLGSPKSIVVVAHGILHYLPFAALRKFDGTLLIDQYGLRFLPSASVLKFLRPSHPGKKDQILVLANPDLGDPKFNLQFAEGEALAVGKLFANSRVLVRKDASETNFKNAGMAFSHIHFATHGKFQADDPLSSGLYLAKDVESDGVLTVGELYSMNINADLVTLSACETGLGKVANGDDVVGLTRGFLYAGSRSIVASLWSVDDNATAELMKMFYQNMAKMNKVQSLRQAQISTRKTFTHPFFWAAFQLTGSGE